LPCRYDERNETPYYNDHHRAWRAKMRHFVETEITPNIEAWEAANEIPLHVYKR
jgi:acyl-CoA dehydrogenase